LLATVLSLVPEDLHRQGRVLGAFVGRLLGLSFGSVCALSHPRTMTMAGHSPGPVASFGAAVAAASLLGLYAAATARALALGRDHTAGHRRGSHHDPRCAPGKAAAKKPACWPPACRPPVWRAADPLGVPAAWLGVLLRRAWTWASARPRLAGLARSGKLELNTISRICVRLGPRTRPLTGAHRVRALAELSDSRRSPGSRFAGNPLVPS